MANDGDIRLDVDSHQVRVAIERLDPTAGKEIRDVVKKATIKVRASVRANAPQKTGLLAGTIRSRTQFTRKYSRGTVFVIGPARKYAWIVEHGSKAQNAFEGRKYIERSEKSNLSTFDQEVQHAVDRALAQVGLDS